MAFIQVQTQWRYAPSGHPTGLDYNGVAVALRGLGIRLKIVFRGLQIMERAVLDDAHRKAD